MTLLCSPSHCEMCEIMPAAGLNVKSPIRLQITARAIHAGKSNPRFDNRLHSCNTRLQNQQLIIPHKRSQLVQYTLQQATNAPPAPFSSGRLTPRKNSEPGFYVRFLICLFMILAVLTFAKATTVCRRSISTTRQVEGGS